MALETLKGITKIDGFDVVVVKEEGAGCSVDYTMGKQNPVMINHIDNRIEFQVQKGPIKENGVNGCQVDTIIATAKIIIEGLNKNFPCRENSIVITKLDEAIMWLKKRKQDREERGVEGKNKA